MFSTETTAKITAIWDAYLRTDKTVRDTKGRVIDNIDQLRPRAIQEIQGMISQFLTGYVDLREFKTALDGYNKRNNLWGFTATKGQMFFNQLVKSSESDLQSLSALLARCISEPKDLQEALDRLDELETYVRNISSKAADKRKVPNPGSVGYFLTYFWQIHDHEKWPLMYTSLTRAFTELGIWEELDTQARSYMSFFHVNEEIKATLRAHAKQEIGNWDAEHAFWNYNGDSLQPQKPSETALIPSGPDETEMAPLVDFKPNFEISDYLIPKVARLVELGADPEKSKASQYEKLVGEIFKQLDFQVDMFGQGTGRNPDAIAKHREENTAFIIDAKAYSSGYTLGVDDRAIREYIGYHTPKLQKEGFKKIGFIIVSNSFRSRFDEFANDVTWNTEIKRFILLTSEALLYLLAYKTKDKISLSSIIDSLVTIAGVVTAQRIIEKFDDI